MDRWWRRKPEDRRFEALKDRAQRSRADELEYFKVDANCLGCGVKTRVKVSRLGQKLRCKRCQTVMHMGANGNWQLGPPPESLSTLEPNWIRAPERSYWRLGDLANTFPLLRNRVFLASAAAAIVLVVALMLARRTNKVTLPSTMLGRSVFLCDAMLLDDRSAFQRCVAYGEARQGLQVYDEVQSRLAREAAPAKPDVRLKVLYENDEEGVGCVVADFYPAADTLAEVPVASRSDIQELFGIVLFWKKTSSGWFLDGRRTADDLTMNQGSSRSS